MADNAEDEVREVLFEAIKKEAPKAGPQGLHHLATAFALAEGAYRGRLPGYMPPSS